jgi:hypothetical protein
MGTSSSSVPIRAKRPAAIVIGDQAERRPRYAAAIARHGGEHACQMRREDGLRRRPPTGGGPGRGQDAPHTGFGGIGEVRAGRRRLAREQRGLGHREQHIPAYLDRPENVAGQTCGRCRMIVAQQELGATLDHQLLAGDHVVSRELKGDRRRGLRLQRAQPNREEGQREDVGGCQPECLRIALRGTQRVLSRDLHAAQHLFRGRPESFARRRQPDVMLTTLEQAGTDPVLQRSNAPTKRGLRHGAALGRPGHQGPLGNPRARSSPFHQPRTPADRRCLWRRNVPPFHRRRRKPQGRCRLGWYSDPSTIRIDFTTELYPRYPRARRQHAPCCFGCFMRRRCPIAAR